MDRQRLKEREKMVFVDIENEMKSVFYAAMEMAINIVGILRSVTRIFLFIYFT